MSNSQKNKKQNDYGNQRRHQCCLYATKQELADAGYAASSNQCKPGDLLLAAEEANENGMLLLRLSAASIRSSDINSHSHTVFKLRSNAHTIAK